MLKYFINKLKKNTEIFGLVTLIFITAIATSYFNFKKNFNEKANNSFVNNIYFKKTLSHIFNNLEPKYKKTKLQGSYWTGQISHLGIGIFAIGLVLNVTQSFSNELIISTGDTVNFGEKEFIILSPYEEIKEEKNVINLPIKFNNKEKNASLNIFKNSSQQAISSPAVFRNIQSDTYITIKVIDDDKFKLIFRENYGIFILWLGLAISSSSFLTRVRK